MAMTNNKDPRASKGKKGEIGLPGRAAGAIVSWVGVAALWVCLPVSAQVERVASDILVSGDASQAAHGLKILTEQPWNHDLRLQVADDLLRSGRLAEARAQLEALEGTPLAAEAAKRERALQRVLRERQLRPLAVFTATTDLAGTSLSEPRLSTPSGDLIPLAPFRYVPSTPAPVETPAAPGAPAAPSTPSRNPEQQQLVTMGQEGDYYALGTEGLALMKKEKLDDDLKLSIANALAWTGRLDDADDVYSQLLSGPRANDARIGLANMHRWQGEDYLAAPLYREVLATQPQNPEAMNGLRLTERELRARTRVTVGGTHDSDDVRRRYASISHQWREPGGARIWEIEGSGVRDTNPTFGINQPEVALRYSALDIPFQPSAEVSVDDHSAYANGTVRLGQMPIWVTAGRVNWGRMAINPLAIDAHLWAWHIGARATVNGVYGSASFRADAYGISDSNNVQTASVRYVPSFRPLGPNIKPLIGIDMRNAKFSSPRYWSPSDGGYGLGYVGVLGEWSSEDWSFYASMQYGWRLFGEAGPSWSFSSGGRYWINNDWAVGMNLWAMKSQRDSRSYRAQSFSVYLERRWN